MGTGVRGLVGDVVETGATEAKSDWGVSPNVRADNIPTPAAVTEAGEGKSGVRVLLGAGGDESRVTAESEVMPVVSEEPAVGVEGRLPYSL